MEEDYLEALLEEELELARELERDREKENRVKKTLFSGTGSEQHQSQSKTSASSALIDGRRTATTTNRGDDNEWSELLDDSSISVAAESRSCASQKRSRAADSSLVSLPDVDRDNPTSLDQFPMRSPVAKRTKPAMTQVLEDLSNIRVSSVPSSPAAAAAEASAVASHAHVRRIPRIGERKIYRRPPSDCLECQAISCADGRRYYVRLRCDDEVESPAAALGGAAAGRSGHRRPAGLCGVPYAVLRDAAVVELSKREAETKARETQAEEAAMIADAADEEPDSGCESMEEDAQTMLWVERFRPRSYMQLLSDDGTNRTVLQWLKLWDKMVFNREKKVRQKRKAEESTWAGGKGKSDVGGGKAGSVVGGGGSGKGCFSCGEEGHMSRSCPSRGKGCFSCGEEGHMSRTCPSRGGGAKAGGGGAAQKPGGAAVAAAAGFAKVSQAEVVDELDDSGRPVQRVAMLHGPPGLGKTTLAHVIASHAGYNVVEMNASDDRSLETFKTKMDAATQMRSVSAKDQRPNCLIIDEIDGAPVATINYLVTIITDKAKLGTKKKKKGSEAKFFLQRPIICICNDLFVPALRPLRQHCLIVSFPPTVPQRLSARLSSIALREKLPTDMTALLALCEKTENDIRACLSTLQFFRKRGLPLRASDVQKTSVGQKDSQKSHNAVWKELFQIPRTNVTRYVEMTGGRMVSREESSATIPARYQAVLRSVYASGEYERLMQGVFENYLDVKFKDGIQNIVKGHDWFAFFDECHDLMLRSQNYTVMAYLPFTFVTVHLLFGTMSKTYIKYPSTEFETRTALTRNQQLLRSLVADMTPAARVFASPARLVRDLLPCLLEIVSPNLRPVNTQLYSPREREELKNLVTILIAYNLTFQQERTTEGEYIYKLDPGVEDVVHFKEVKHRQLPYAIKQMIAHEVEVEKLRRHEKPAEGSGASSSQDGNAAAKQRQKKPGADADRGANEKNPTHSDAAEKANEKKPVPSHLQKLEAKDISRLQDHAPKDFFGRKIKSTHDAKGKHAETNKTANDIVKSDIWFKFKEGYNNAVRRTVRLKDML